MKLKWLIIILNIKINGENEWIFKLKKLKNIIYSNDKFICSCDNMTEINKKIKLIEKDKLRDEVCK